MNGEEISKIVITGLVLGITAAAVVWFLERFEMNRFHGEIQTYLDRRDEFKEWLKARELGTE